MKRDDVLSYLDSYRKTDESDPLHKWIGTYNVKRAALVMFFRWLNNPHLRPGDRPIPAVMSNIYQLKSTEDNARDVMVILPPGTLLQVMDLN